MNSYFFWNNFFGIKLKDWKTHWLSTSNILVFVYTLDMQRWNFGWVGWTKIELRLMRLTSRWCKVYLLEYSQCPVNKTYHKFILEADLFKSKQDTVVLWSKSSTLDRKVEGSNPAATHFSFEVDDLDAHKRKKMETKTGAPANDHWRASALEIELFCY